MTQKFCRVIGVTRFNEIVNNRRTHMCDSVSNLHLQTVQNYVECVSKVAQSLWFGTSGLKLTIMEQ